jgi:hypothetical protein
MLVQQEPLAQSVQLVRQAHKAFKVMLAQQVFKVLLVQRV